MPRLLALAVVLVWTGRIAEAAIDWRAPAGCPDAASVKARVERRLGRSLDDATVDLSIVVTRTQGRYVARIASVERTLTSTRCHELADAVAVIVARIASEAMARAELDREAAGIIIYDAPPMAAMVATTAPASAAAATPSVVEHVDTGLQPASGEYVPRPWTIGARVSGLSGIGLIPQVGLGAEVAVTVRAGRHLAELGQARWARSTAQFIVDGPRNVDVDLDVTVARYGWRSPSLPLRAWLAVEVGAMQGGGAGLPIGQIDDSRWVAAGTGFGIAWQMAPWIRLVGSTEAMVAIERAKFSNGDMIVYAPSPLSVRTTCGLEVGWQ